MKKFKYLIIIVLLGTGLIVFQIGQSAFAAPESCCGDGGRCTGKSNCKVCSNCSRCAHCNSGGSCGVCASYTPPPKKYNPPPKETKPVVTVPKSSGASTNGYYVNSNTLNVRSGPSTNHSILCTLSFGEEVTVLSNTNGLWVKISTTACSGLVMGYVSGKYLSKK